MRIEKILLRGPSSDDAVIIFQEGANILAGESDTGKSLLLHYLDYILGADELRKRVPESEPYAQLFIQFARGDGKSLTLERSLAGGDLAVHEGIIDDFDAPSRKIAPRRYGTSNAEDVTSVLFDFAGIPEAKLRKNNRGEVQRLTIRTLVPIFMVDEISIIAEQSPVLGPAGFDDTARKRMFAFLLTGKDDSTIIAVEKREIANARLNAGLSVVDSLLTPLQQRLADISNEEAEDSIEKLDSAIDEIRRELEETTGERADLQEERSTASASLQRAETQVVAIDELLLRYNLLNQRYQSDLDRLDFIAEGVHFFDDLQEVNCPLCGQLMTADHRRHAEPRIHDVYEASKAEAAKIRSQQADLAAVVETLQERREEQIGLQRDAQFSLRRAETRLESVLAPRLRSTAARLECRC